MKFKIKRYHYIFSFSFFTFFCIPITSAIKIVSLIGAPGAGKGTLAAQCIHDLHYTSLSIGNVLREEIKKQTPLGLSVASINNGKFAPDEIVMKIVKTWLEEKIAMSNTFILDGFPRTANQVQLFLELLKTSFENCSFYVVNLDAHHEIIHKRILNRIVCSQCQSPSTTQSHQNATCPYCNASLVKRPDDTIAIISERLAAYDQLIQPILETYHKENIPVITIDTNHKTAIEVFLQFKKIFNNK